jgi:hypothetical protein
LEFETVYLPARFPWPKDKAQRIEIQKEIYNLNLGSRGSKRWHPAPRVVVGEPWVLSGRIDRKLVTAHLRSGLYGKIRACYDEQLRQNPTLHGRTWLRMNVGKSGTIRSVRVVPAPRKAPKAFRQRRDPMPNAKVKQCFAKVFRKARAAVPRSRSSLMLGFVDVWPGDHLLPEPADTSPQPEIPLAPVQRELNSWRAAIEPCFQQASKKTPGLAGRLLLQVELKPTGSITAASEVESTFPDEDCVQCVARVLLGKKIPLPSSNAANIKLMIPFRWAASRVTGKNAEKDEE